jgi:hypothetical protein
MFRFTRNHHQALCKKYKDPLHKTTEWPKKMYTLFTHQYLWNKFK